MEDCFSLPKSADPDEMPQNVAFHLGLHCLPNYTFMNFQYKKGSITLTVISPFFFRDMKPENILLTDEMHILITDFGSAKILKKEPDISSTGEFTRKTFFMLN